MELTRTRFYREYLDLPVDAATAYIYVVRAFRSAGARLVEKPEFMAVFGKISGGLVPRADLTGLIEAVGESSCRLTLKSVAQEEMSSPGAGTLALQWLLNEIRMPIEKLVEAQPSKCKRCHQMNPRGARYCENCGTPLYIPTAR